MNHHNTVEDFLSVTAGFVSAILGRILLSETFLHMWEAFLMGATGAAGGWLMKRAIDYIIIKIKKTKNK